MQGTRLDRRDARWTAVLGAVLLVLSARPAAAATLATRRFTTGLPPSISTGGLPLAWAAPAPAAPVIDGRIDEGEWAKAHPIVLGRLESHGRSSPRSEARFLQKDGILYAGFVLAEPEVARMWREVTKADGPAHLDDSIELFLSPAGDTGYFQIIVSATAAIYDRKDHGDPAGWNSGAKAATVVGTNGWSVEVAIPMASMCPNGRIPERWRGNVYRNRHAGAEGRNQAWSPTLRADYDVPDRFGYLFLTPAPPWAKEEGPGREGGIRVTALGQEKAVLRFDLSDLHGMNIHRARLVCEREAVETTDPDALADIEIYPIAAPYAEGVAPKTDPGPLELVGPGYRSFEMTSVVRGWVTGTRPNHGLHVKTFPGWRVEKTCLDVTFEGKPEGVPPQVAGIRAFHRAGQTFITFREVDPLGKEDRLTWGEIRGAIAGARDAWSYRIYAHDEPIDTETINEARLVGDVGPFSGYNLNGRNVEYLIGRAMLEPDEMGELARDYNGYIYSWHMDHPRMDRYPVRRFVIEDMGMGVDEKAGPLPAGAGLYVHHPAAAGRRYYAVVSCRNGVENRIELSEANALQEPIAESSGPGEPVCQGDGLWGPYFDYPGRRRVYVQWCAPPLSPRPNMYFNWSVLIPPVVGSPAPAELYFHPAGYSYAQPGKKLLRSSIQIAPHDYPESGWYGFNDAWGTLRSYGRGTVRDHTQRRIIAFLDWALGVFPIDPDRILAVGSDGAAMAALGHPDRFACVFITGFDSRVLDPKAARNLAAAWGPRTADIDDGQGRAEWIWADLDRRVLESRGKDLPLFVCRGPSWGRVPGWGKGRGRFYDAMHRAGQPLVAHWAWGGELIAPDTYTGLWRGLDIRRESPVPAFANCSLDQEGEGGGNTNVHITWKDLTDEPDRFEVTVTGQDCTFDMTLRRRVMFRPKPGEVIRWEAVPIPRDRSTPGPARGGHARAGEDGVVTIRGLGLRGGGLRITLASGR